MIQLYHFNNSNFDKNGDIILLPDMCEVTAGINRTWQLDIHHPIDKEGRWKGIINNAVIKAPSFKPYGEQLWRIVQTEKSDSGITAVCDPICYDAAQEVFFIQKSVNNLTAQSALDFLCEGTRYSAYSDVEGRHSTRYHLVNLIEVVQSHENGIQKVWGGEVGFNNYQIQLFKHIGGEPGTVISYGKNIAVDGFTESVDIDGVVTRLIPEGYGGRLMDGVPWVDSPYIDRYATPRIGTINYEELRLKGDPEGDEEKDGIYFDTKEELDAALRAAAEKEFEEGLDRPKVNLEIDVVLLENTREYKDFINVDDYTLGDEVICRHDRLDVDTESRVIQVRFDCIKERIVYLEIGDRKRNYFDNVSSTVESVKRAITPAGDVIASQIDGFINGARAQLRIQNTVAQRQEAIAILFEDTDPDSDTFGALALGTQGLQVSKTRNGNEWDWGTAITSEGVIANYIVAGILSDKNAFNYWNLDTGEFRLASTATVGGQTVQQIANNAATAAVDAQTQTDIFNKLTNNGALQGIYMSDGQLYINGTYIKAGIIDANLIKAGIIKDTLNKNFWNLATGEFSLSAAATVGGSTVQTIANNAASAAVAAQTQTDIFNKLTNNGALQGIYMSNGQLYINGTYIKAGTIDANLLRAGIIADTQNKNFWNLATGEFSLSAAATVGGSTVQTIANNAASSAVAAQTQTDIFNKLTNNGALQGIYMQGGELYVNGTYIKTGQIDANLITAGIIKDAANKNSWNLTTGALSTNGAVVAGGSITGTSINNGSGTFQVDAAGNLKASSAEITGDIKSGSTITGSTITGSVITTAGTRTDDPVSPGTTFNYTSSLENGNIVFTRTGVGTSTYDGTITIQGGGITADFDSAAMVATMSNVFSVKSKNNTQDARYGLTCVITDSPGNYTRQTGSNFEIYRNGVRVWSAV